MTEIRTEDVTVSKSAMEVFNYLDDLNNLFHLLPQDKITDWKGEKEKCSFKFQGAVKLKLIKEDAKSPEFIKFVSGENSPVYFSLTVNIKPVDDTSCIVGQVSHADLNPIMKMMVQKPLKNLFDYISGRLVTVMQD
jgi:hypothetical protein